MSSAATTTFTAFEWVPDFARGLVRDLRVRWACEELGRPYRAELLKATSERPAEYLDRQPFDQVPAFDDGDVTMFETGAILMYLADTAGGLLPADGQGRWTTISWLFAALNSVEPFVMRLATYDLFHADKPWAREAYDLAAQMADRKLMRLSHALGQKAWLAEDFSIADIAMVTVLQNLRRTDMVAKYANLAAYRERGEARPAYKRALAAQMADFKDQP